MGKVKGKVKHGRPTKEFNELFHRHFMGNPEFKTTHKGQVNEHKFEASVTLPRVNLTYNGKGTSRQRAKIDAAKKALDQRKRWAI